jgi:lipoprotein-anchoring transpeptidase ErfK/SrfK
MPFAPRVIRRWLTAVGLVTATALLASACTASSGPDAGSPVIGTSTVGGTSGGSGSSSVPGQSTSVVTVPSTGPAGPTDTGSAAGSGTGSTTSGSGDIPAVTTSIAPTTTSTPPPVATVSASPAFGSTGVSVVAPITISVGHGKITALTLTNPTGKAVDGEISDDGTTWKLGEVLGYGKKYTVTGTALGTDGRTVPIAGTFTTMDPAKKVNARINLGDGAVVGVAASVIITFDGVKPADRALIEKNVTITTTPKVEGAWGWIDHDGGVWGLDYRTKDFWPAGTKVHVEANVYGLAFGGGAFGAADVSSDFTIGRNQVVYADVNSHYLVVKRDGKTVATYPASYGRGTDYDTTTRSGIHVVNAFYENKLMSNPKYHYTNVLEHWAVRISNNGEFIHANPKTVGDQGNTNVSHGCVNLSTDNAKAYYDSALYGDPVIVTGTNVQLSPADGDLFDWTVPWSEWLRLSALS